MNQVEFNEEVFKHLKTSGLSKHEFYAYKNVQIEYLSKCMRNSEFYISLGAKERPLVHKGVAILIDDFCKEEEIEVFSFCELYQYLLKTFYGKHKE